MQLALSLLFLNAPLWAFEGVGDCPKILMDYAFLEGKSMFLPKLLSGHCVIKDSRSIPKIMKAAGYKYKEDKTTITLEELPPPPPPIVKAWQPPLKRYLVNFAFLNKQSSKDCGLTMNDILASFSNLKLSFSVAGSFGCPAFEDDGTFAFSVVAALTDEWQYTHGTETQRANTEITTTTGAVSTSYDYITTGLDIKLNQTENGQFYNLRYTSRNGSITTNHGAITELIESDITETYEKKRKLWIIPLGSYTVEAMYKMVLQLKELK